MSNLITKLKCVTPAIVTPLKRDGSVDEQGLKNVVRYVTKRGMKTLFILGYCGEGRAFDRAQRKRVIEITRETASDDIMIIAGAMADSTDLIVNYCDDAYNAGADMALATPTDFFYLTDEELEGLFIQLNDRIKLPLMIYNCPENHHYISPGIMARLSRLPNIMALKQTSNADQLQEMQMALEPETDFIMLSGNEHIFYPAMCLGVEGFIMGGPGNFSPQECVDLFEDYKKGELESVRSRYFKMNAFWKDLYQSLPYPMAMPQIKAVMEIAGVCERWVHSPVKSVTDDDMKVIEALLKKHNVNV